MEMLKRSQAAYDAGEYLDAFAWSSRHTTERPEDWHGLYGSAVALLKVGHYGTALHLFGRAAEMCPDHVCDPVNGIGRCYQEQGDYRAALEYFERAAQIDPFDFHAINNIGLCYLNLGRFEDAAAFAQRAVDMQPDCLPAYDNLSMSSLALHKFGVGWDYAEMSIGSPKRDERIYGDEGRWDGTRVDTVVCYGEQGIGDEILFSSCIPDLIGAVDNVIVDSKTPRLKGLFQRSFPTAAVVNSKQDEIEIKGADARVSMAVLPKFFRREREAFGKPHLVADPERRRMVRGLLDGLPGKKVGIAWTGGLPDTRKDERSTLFDSLYGDLRGLDATFVSLEYKPAEETFSEIQGAENVRHFPFLTNTQDYDDTAALVAELDLVVAVTTSVVHLAGGLGVPVRILVPDPPSWKYGGSGEDFYWWDSAKLIRQRKGEWNLTSIRSEIDER
jgi:hypothetical protein